MKKKMFCFQGLSAVKLPLLAYLKDYWIKDSPFIDYYCLHGPQSWYQKAHNLCENRGEFELYYAVSGFSQCHCDSYCEKFRDCCLDYLTNRRDNLLDHEVQCLSTEFPERRFPLIGFYLIATCSHDFHDASIVKKCR